MYTVHKDEQVMVWDFQNQKVLNSQQYSISYQFERIILFQAESYLLVVSSDGSFLRLDPQTLSIITTNQIQQTQAYQQLSTYWIDEQRKQILQLTFKNQLIIINFESGSILTYSDFVNENLSYLNYFKETGEILVQSTNMTFYNFDCFHSGINTFKLQNLSNVNIVKIGKIGEYFVSIKNQNSVSQIFRFINRNQQASPYIIFKNQNKYEINSILYISQDIKNNQSPSLYLICSYQIVQLDLNEGKESVITEFTSVQYIQMAQYNTNFQGLLYIDFQNKIQIFQSQSQAQIPIIKQDILFQYTPQLSYRKLLLVKSILFLSQKMFIITNQPQLNLLVYDQNLQIKKMFSFNPTNEYMNKNNFNVIPDDSSYESTYLTQDAKVLVKENFLVKYAFNIIEVYYLQDLIYEISEDSYIIGAYIQYTEVTQYLLVIKQNSQFYMRHLKTGVVINTQVFPNIQIYNYQISSDAKIIILFGYQSDNYSVISISAWSLDDNMLQIGASNGVAICKGSFLKMDISASNKYLLVVCSFSFSFMKISNKMDLLNNKSYSKNLQSGFIDEDPMYICVFGNQDTAFAETYSYTLPKVDGNLATLTLYDSRKFFAMYTQAVIVLQKEQKRMTLFNPARTDVLHYFYIRKLSKTQELYFQYSTLKVTSTNYMTAYNNNEYRVFFSYFNNNNYSDGRTKYGYFDIISGISKLNIFGVYFDPLTKYFYCSADGNLIFYFDQQFTAPGSFEGMLTTDKQFYDLIVDKNQVYSISNTDFTNNILSVGLNSTYNQLVQYNNANYQQQNYLDICFNTNRTYALIITNTTAVISNVVNLIIAKKLGDSTYSNVVQCFSTNNYFGVLYQQNMVNSQIAIYSQDRQFTFIGMINPTNNQIISSFIMVSVQIIYISKGSIFTANLPDKQSQDQTTISSDPNFDGMPINLIALENKFYILYQQSLILYQTDKTVVSILRISKLNQQESTLSRQFLVQTPVLISLQNNFSKLNLDKEHQFVWIESQIGEVLVHDSISFKQIMYLKNPKKYSFISHSMVFTKNEAFICWLAKCIRFEYTQSIINGTISYSLSKDTQFIELNTQLSVFQISYDEMSQQLILCSNDQKNLFLHSKQGLLIKQIQNIQSNNTNNTCQGLIVDKMYNRIYSLGKMNMTIYDLSFLLQSSTSFIYQDQQYYKNPFLNNFSYQNQLDKLILYIPNRDEVVKVYDINQQIYQEPIYIPGLKQIIPFKNNLLAAKTDNELILIDMLTKQVKNKSTFNGIQQFEIVNFNQDKNILIVFDKDKIRLIDYDSNYQIQFSFMINLGSLINLVQTDGVMMIAADSQNNIYDINITNQTFTMKNKSVLSNLPVSTLIINSKHQILVVFYDGQKAEFFSRKGNTQQPLQKIYGLNISEKFNITNNTTNPITNIVSNITNTVNGTLRSCIYEEARQLVFILTQNLGRLFVFQYQSDFSKIAPFKLINVPTRQTKTMFLKMFVEIKTLAIITSYQIDLLDQDSLYPYQILRDQEFISISNFHFRITNNKDYLGILTTTSNLFIFYFDQVANKFVKIKIFPIDNPKFVNIQQKSQMRDIQTFQIIGFSNLGTVFSISTNLNISQQTGSQQPTNQINECMVQILNPSYGYIQYTFNSLKAGRLLLDNQSDITKYRIIFKDGLFSKLNFQLPDFSQDYSLDFIGNSSQPILNITNEFLNFLNPVELYLENLQIVSGNSQIVFNNKLRNTDYLQKQIANIVFQSVTFNTQNSISQFVFQEFQSISFNNTQFNLAPSIKNMSFILINNSQIIKIQNTNIKDISLIGSNLIHIIGADIENQRDEFEKTIVEIQNLKFENMKLIDSNIINFEMIHQTNMNQIYFVNSRAIQDLQQIHQSILVKMCGLQLIQMTQVNFTNNIDVQLIQYSPTYQDQKFENIYVEKTLKSQNISIIQSNLTQNIIQTIPYSLIYINARYFQLNNMNFNQNQVNQVQSYQLNQIQQNQLGSDLKQNQYDGETSVVSVFGSENFIVSKCNFIQNKATNGGSLNIQNTQNFIIEDSTFQNNEALINGGALYIQNDEQFKFYQQIFQNQIIRSLFQGNSAKVGGGAIYSKRTNYTLYDSIIKDNYSSIGGAIRCLDRTPPYPDAFISSIQSDLRKLTSDQYNNTVQNNKATIFGQNFGSFPLAIKSDNQIIGSDLVYDNFRSGDIITNLSLQLLDEEFNPVKLQQKGYGITSNSDQIIIQLQNGNAKAFSDEIFLKDQITAKYDYDKFLFTNLQIIGVPGKEQQLYIQIPSLKVFNNSQDQFLQSPPLKIKIQFRKCIVGEILESVCPSCQQFSCRVCEEGTYSLLDPNLQQVNTCKLCPFEQASFCKLNQIILKSGYWRKNSLTDEIFYCENSPQNCYGLEENNYCVEGFTGPLCETCDIEKKVWNQRYGKVSNKVNQCYKCSEIEQGISSIILPFIGVLAYIIFSINRISSMAQQYLYATYLRKCHILAVGSSGQADKFSLYSKIFMNFLQISMSILQMKISIPTQIFTLFNIIGDPISTSQFSLDCYLDSLPFSIPVAYYRILWSQIIPISLFILLVIGYLVLVLFRCFKFEKKFIYSMLLMLLIFMQTGIAQILFKSISCRQFGNSGSYMLSQLTEECWTSTHILFTLSLTIPAIIIWILLVPLIFFYRIFVASKNKKLDRFQTIQRYGYLYQEYRQNKFYWEFIKMYERVFITLSLVYFNNYPIEQGFCISFIILLYIYLSYTHRPYLNQQINLIDQRSSLAQILIALLATLYNSSNQQINKQWILFTLFGIQIIFIIYMIILLAKDCIQTNNSYFITQLKLKTVQKFPYLSKHFRQLSENPWKKLANWQLLRLNTHLWLVSRRQNSQILWEDFAEKKSRDVKSICQQISQLSKNKGASNELLKNSSLKIKSENQDLQSNSVNQKISLYTIKNEPNQESNNLINQLSFIQNQNNALVSLQKDSNQQPDNLDYISHYSLASQKIPSEMKINSEVCNTEKQIYKTEYFNDQNDEFALPVLRESDVFPSYINKVYQQKLNSNIISNQQSNIDQYKQIQKYSNQQVENNLENISHYSASQIIPSEMKINSDRSNTQQQIYKVEYFNDQNDEFALPVLRESDVFPSYINKIYQQKLNSNIISNQQSNIDQYKQIQKYSKQQVENNLENISHNSLASQIIPSEMKINSDRSNAQQQIYKDEYFNNQNNEFALPMLNEKDVFPSYINLAQNQMNSNIQELNVIAKQQTIVNQDKFIQKDSYQQANNNLDQVATNKLNKQDVFPTQINREQEKIILSIEDNKEKQEANTDQDNQIDQIQSNQDNNQFDEFKNTENNENQIIKNFIKNQNIIKRNTSNVPVIPLQLIVSEEDDDQLDFNQINIANLIELQKISLNDDNYITQKGKQNRVKQNNETSEVLDLNEQDNQKKQNFNKQKELEKSDSEDNNQKIRYLDQSSKSEKSDDQTLDFIFLSDEVNDMLKNKIKIKQYQHNNQQLEKQEFQAKEQTKQKDSLQDLDVFIDLENLSKNIIDYRNQIKIQDLFNNLSSSKQSDINENQSQSFDQQINK
ncbi:transmembrane protein, putative (macronuclear) [Tetrahymena thermophila SB210]|uniref:Transmembrane protein, putative n=1 Tax=Tetrahymena thermophila (strain SB210) TaxID=312017 RepID=I7M4P5_TETTS|nr:transmembrane protein, putative [Tetrahymena thermophila SB210]EAS07788.2 transmembrane protein, putative [Tetrahymena thermophila SB210]|eukprot:XP_001028030.2 transmembrane protein, putative [Tetrahymena thermophila SB210]